VFKNSGISVNTPSKIPLSKENVDDGKTRYNKEGNRNALIEHRRSLGLCFKCGEKYYPAHQCKIKAHMMIEQEEGNELDQNISEAREEEEYKVEEVVISMFAISKNPHLSTMRFKGKIVNKKICTLVDSGSTQLHIIL
jgi:hypothetical protein